MVLEPGGLGHSNSGNYNKLERKFPTAYRGDTRSFESHNQNCGGCERFPGKQLRTSMRFVSLGAATATPHMSGTGPSSGQSVPRHETGADCAHEKGSDTVRQGKGKRENYFSTTS